MISPFHPLEPLTSAEQASAVQILKDNGKFSDSCKVASIVLKEPCKEEVFKWTSKTPFNLNRVAFCVYLDGAKNLLQEAVVDLGAKKVLAWKEVPGQQSLFVSDEADQAFEMLRKNERLAKILKNKYGITDINTVTMDMWSNGYNGPDPLNSKRLGKILMFVMDPVTRNPYAKPIEGLRPIVDLNQMKLVNIEDHGDWPIPPGHECHYKQKVMPNKFENILKPLEIVQKKGPSFTVQGNYVEWDKWAFVVGFNGREGLVLHDIRLDNRTVLYRASMAEMMVPYGDPKHQHATKNAFDEGEFGLGNCANSLALGCDCLGEIHYIDGQLLSTKGEAWTIKNAVCMHEEDYGLLWKHVDRTDGAEVRRSRRLVISMIATVENYDYCFYWYLYQDGTIEFEVKMTGFLSVGALYPGERSKYGKLVAPQVYGPNHQHYFNVRLDFALDGIQNRAYQVDIKPDHDNDFLNAFFANKQLLETEDKSMANICVETARTWVVENDNSLNALGEAVGFKLIPGANTVPFAHPEAYWRKRARYLDYHTWVTPFNNKEYFPGGDYVNQHSGGEGIPKWVQQKRSLVDQDLVLWYSLGMTHIPRPEDWPVMPVAKVGFMLKPDGFFAQNPGTDIAPQCVVNNDN